MAQTTAGRVEVCSSGGKVRIRVSGRATHLISQPLREYGLKMIRSGLTDISIDLGGCVYLDSTFAGVLAGLSMKLKDVGGSLTLRQVPARCGEVLQTLGILRLFQLEAAADAVDPAAHVTALPTGARSREAWAGTILEAHRLLADAERANEGRFEDVLEFLRTEMPSAIDTAKLKH